VVEVSDKSEPAITNFFEKAGFMIELERRLIEEGETTFKKYHIYPKKSPETV
jgi:hypothetical protein